MTGGASISATTRRARLSWVSRVTVPPWTSSCVIACADSEFDRQKSTHVSHIPTCSINDNGNPPARKSSRNGLTWGFTGRSSSPFVLGKIIFRLGRDSNVCFPPVKAGSRLGCYHCNGNLGPIDPSISSLHTWRQDRKTLAK